MAAGLPRFYGRPITHQMPLQEDGRIAAQLMITFEWSDWCTPSSLSSWRKAIHIAGTAMLLHSLADVLAVPSARLPHLLMRHGTGCGGNANVLRALVAGGTGSCGGYSLCTCMQTTGDEGSSERCISMLRRRLSGRMQWASGSMLTPTTARHRRR